jgi:hypothetical protein
MMGSPNEFGSMASGTKSPQLHDCEAFAGAAAPPPHAPPLTTRTADLVVIGKGMLCH